MKLGNSNPVHHFTFLANSEVAETVGQVAMMALEVEEMAAKGDLFAFAIKVADDPHKRRSQYFMMLQLIEQRFGPKETEDFQVYFDSKLQLQ